MAGHNWSYDLWFMNRTRTQCKCEYWNDTGNWHEHSMYYRITVYIDYMTSRRQYRYSLSLITENRYTYRSFSLVYHTHIYWISLLRPLLCYCTLLYIAFVSPRRALTTPLIFGSYSRLCHEDNILVIKNRTHDFLVYVLNP